MHLVTGGIAGAVSRTATSPLERLRILQQTASEAYVGKGTISSLNHMYKTEGFSGFFKGNGLTILKIAPFSAIEFYCYELYKSNLFPGLEKHQLSYMQKLIAGGLTGVTAQTLTYPMDLLKTYMTINIDNATKPSMWKLTQEIIARDGIMGLYRGLGVSNCGIAPFIGIKMSSFDLVTAFTIGKGPEAQKKLSKTKLVYMNLINGALSGTIAVTATYPIDLTRRLMQLNGTDGHNYSGLLDCCKQLF